MISDIFKGTSKFSGVMRGSVTIQGELSGGQLCVNFPGRGFSGGNFLGAIILGGNCPGSNFPGGNCPGRNYMGSSYPGGNYPMGGECVIVLETNFIIVYYFCSI